jgi:hypothetical protein
MIGTGMQSVLRGVIDASTLLSGTDRANRFRPLDGPCVSLLEILPKSRASPVPAA